MIWNFGVIKKNLLSLFFGKILSLGIYIVIIHFINLLVFMFISTVVFGNAFEVPDFGIGICNFLVNSLIMLFYSLIGVMFSLICKNSAFGSFVGFIIYLIFSFSIAYPSLKSVLFLTFNVDTYYLQKILFGGTNEQFSYILGDMPFAPESSAIVIVIIYLAYALTFLAASFGLYVKRARN